MQTASKPRAPAPVCSYEGGNYSIEYGRQPPFTLKECREDRSQLIVLPDADCEAELYWREPGQASRGIRLEGPHVVYIPSGVPYTVEWRRKAAWLRFSFTPEFIRQSGTRIPPPGVFICHEWKMAGADLMVRQLFHEFGELCRHPEDTSDCPRYLEALGSFAARRIVSPLNGKSPRCSGCLPHPQLKRVLEHIDKNLRKKTKTGDLARIAGFGQHHFTRLFKASTGMTPRRFIIMRKLECARELSARGGMNAAEIADASGFYDQSHLEQSRRKYCKAFRAKSNADIIQEKAGLFQDSGANTGQNGGVICPDGVPHTAAQSPQVKKTSAMKKMTPSRTGTLAVLFVVLNALPEWAATTATAAITDSPGPGIPLILAQVPSQVKTGFQYGLGLLFMIGFIWGVINIWGGADRLKKGDADGKMGIVSGIIIAGAAAIMAAMFYIFGMSDGALTPQF